MQFQKVGHKIKVIEYVGYSKEKRRSMTRMILSLDHLQTELTDEQKKGLSERQIGEIQSYLNRKAQAEKERSDRLSVGTLPYSLERAADYLEQRPDEAATLATRWDEMYSSWKRIRRVIRKSKGEAAVS